MRRKNKRLLSLALTLSLGLSVCGCGNKETTTSEATTQEVTEVSSSNAYPEATTEAIGDIDTPEAKKVQDEFETYLDDSFKESVVSDTITLHYTLANPEKYGIEKPEVTYGETGISEDEIKADKEQTEEELAELKDFDRSLLTADQRFLYDILVEKLETDMLFYDNIYLYEPFAYTSGLQSNLPITLSEYKLYDAENVEEYLKLLELTPDYFQVYLDFETIKIDKGLFMNQHSAEEVIRQCKEFIETPEKNLLIETFQDNIKEVPGLSEEQIADYEQKNHDAVINYIIPTYESVIDFFTEHKKDGKNEYGLAKFSGGTDYYKYLIKSKVGSNRTPEEIIELIESYISSTLSDFQKIAFFNYDSYEAYFDDSDKLYEDTDPKEAILYFEDAFKDRFPTLPDIQFTVEPVHESLEGIVSPAFFMQPALDKYEENSIYTNLNSDGAGNIWSTYAHEGIPGHMYQFVYFLSNDPYPLHAMLDFNGYAEGWATYVEQMSFDYYEGYADPVYADIERLNSMLNLLVSARVEIGVNYEGWDLEATKEYLSDSGFSADAAQGLMDYVIAEPANYQMYVLGWLEFEELRTYTEMQLGTDFDEQEFHKVLLDAGPCQFDLLGKRVESYVATKKAQ